MNSHFLSLYRDYSNSLALSNASELFWSWISINHIQVHKEKENFVIACLRPSQNVKLGIFTGSRAVDGKEMYKKAWCTCKVVFLPCQAIAFLLSRHRHILNLILFTICCDPSETEFSQCKLNCSCQDPLWLLLLLIASETVYDSSVFPSFQVRKALWTNRATVAR